MILKMITKEKIELAKRIYSDLKKWNNANNILTQYFKTNSKNNSQETILIKVLLIDSLYKTNLKDQLSVAENISKISLLGDRLNKGEISAVEDISKWNGKNLLSFASKFCHFHNKNEYPIYDKYVVVALKKLLPDWKDNRTYSNFLDGINKFRERNLIKEVSFEELDKFLWLFGMLLRLDAGKIDINREIKAYYDANKGLFDKLKEE